MVKLIDIYGNVAALRHPSWRVYRALQIINSPDFVNRYEESIECPTLKDFGLKDIEVFIPYKIDDDLTYKLVEIFTTPPDKLEEDTVYNIPDCMRIFMDVNTRQLIEGMLLAGIQVEDIAGDAGTSPQTIQVYSSVFFDTSVWRSQSDRMHYVYKGTVGRDAEIKTKVIELGVDYVLVNYFHLPEKIRLDKVLLDGFSIAYKKLKQTSDMDDLESQACAQRWLAGLISSYKELNNITAKDGGIRELKIALETHRAPSRSIADLD